MNIHEELVQLAERMQTEPEAIRSLNAVYHFKLNEGTAYQIRFQNGLVEVAQDTPDHADCTLLLSEQTLRKLLRDDLNTTMAFMTGSLKIDGKISLAMKLQEAVKKYTRTQ